MAINWLFCKSALVDKVWLIVMHSLARKAITETRRSTLLITAYFKVIFHTTQCSPLTSKSSLNSPLCHLNMHVRNVFSVIPLKAILCIPRPCRNDFCSSFYLLHEALPIFTTKSNYLFTMLHTETAIWRNYNHELFSPSLKFLFPKGKNYI